MRLARLAGIAAPAALLLSALPAVSAAPARAATPLWPANPDWQRYVEAPTSTDLHPVRVVRASGDVVNAAGLVNHAGGTTLTYSAGGTAPTIVLDYGQEVGGLPQFTVDAQAVAPGSDQLAWSPNASLIYTSRPFAGGATLAGPITASIDVESSTPDAEIVATLNDVAPDGTTTAVYGGLEPDGALVGSQRALDMSKSWTDSSGRLICSYVNLPLLPYKAFAPAADASTSLAGASSPTAPSGGASAGGAPGSTTPNTGTGAADVLGPVVLALAFVGAATHWGRRRRVVRRSRCVSTAR